MKDVKGYTYSLKPKNVYVKYWKCINLQKPDTHVDVIYSPAHVDNANSYPRIHHFACRGCGLQFFVSISETEINVWEETNYANLKQFGVPKRKTK